MQADNILTLEPVSDAELAEENRVIEGDKKVPNGDCRNYSHPATTPAFVNNQFTQVNQVNNQTTNYNQTKRTLSTSSQQSHPSTQSTEHYIVNNYMFSTPTYPHMLNGVATNGDLTCLPKPRGIYPSGDLPWVYRHKVKRSMNELSKIMSSKVVLADSEYQLF